jgi:hypothetical protein
MDRKLARNAAKLAGVALAGAALLVNGTASASASTSHGITSVTEVPHISDTSSHYVAYDDPNHVTRNCMWPVNKCSCPDRQGSVPVTLDDKYQA